MNISKEDNCVDTCSGEYIESARTTSKGSFPAICLSRSEAIAEALARHEAKCRPHHWLLSRLSGGDYVVVPVDYDYIEITPEMIDEIKEIEDIDITPNEYFEGCFE